MVLAAALTNDLKRLRKGRAILVHQIAEHIGPALGEVCGVTDGDSPTEIRTKVISCLHRLAEELPSDLRVAVLAALAIHRDAQHALYGERVRWLAGRLERDDRTARRRIDEGIERLTELAVTTVDGCDSPTLPRSAGWHAERIQVALVLDRTAPEAFEFRRIAADRDGLTELDLALTLTARRHGLAPAAPPELDVDVIYGGTLVRRARESVDRLAFALELPGRLDRHDVHEFALQYRVPDGRPMLPHYVCVLRQRCDRFDLRARFDRTRPPQRVWRVDAAFQRDIDDPAPGGPLLTPDPAGEIRLTFSQLTPGLAYGVRWEP